MDELDEMPEEAMVELLAYIGSLKPVVERKDLSPFMEAYEQPVERYEEVYRRLADS
ncbi:MAG: DUF2281 domain-containing protein [Leptolyngbya sp. DLM2.Bin27]|nr:MAG: DUF2281 domain-containing protein [Leptolyngbya sp. DLM2.Bin27]